MTTVTTLKLYTLRIADGREPSPFVWRARMALAHKGLVVERVPIGYGEKDKLAFSRQGLVPVLVDGERWVNDSWAIAQYLEDTYPQRPTLFGGRWPADDAVRQSLDRRRNIGCGPASVARDRDHIPAADQAYFRRRSREEGRHEPRGDAGGAGGEDRRVPPRAGAGTADARADSSHLCAMRRAMPITACSAASCGLGRSRRIVCWTPTIRFIAGGRRFCWPSAGWRDRIPATRLTDSSQCELTSRA